MGKIKIEIGDAIEFEKSFNFAHRGCINYAYAAGQTVIVGDACTEATITERGAEAALEMEVATFGDAANVGGDGDEATLDISSAAAVIAAIEACETREALNALCSGVNEGAMALAAKKWSTVDKAGKAKAESFDD